jgi:hypothetical protein
MEIDIVVFHAAMIGFFPGSCAIFFLIALKKVAKESLSYDTGALSGYLARRSNPFP